MTPTPTQGGIVHSNLLLADPDLESARPDAVWAPPATQPLSAPAILLPQPTVPPWNPTVTERVGGSRLGRRGMITAIAGSSVGLAVLISGCANDSVDEAVQKARAIDGTLPDPKLTATQPTLPLATGTERLGPPAPLGEVSTPVTEVAQVIPDVATPAAAVPLPEAVGTGAVATTTRTSSNRRAPAPAAPAPPTPPASVDPVPAPPVVPTPPPVVPAPPPPPPGPTAAELEIMHKAQLLSKLVYGATAADIDQVASLGAVGFLDKQLAMTPADTTNVLTGAHSLDDTIADRYQKYKDQDSNRPAREMRHAAVIRAARSDAQLAERMVEFWSNHFSTYSGEEDKNVRFATASDDRDIFRKYALGRFSELLLASARSVSMQLYLDNYRSTGNNPNQNYAREIMELHTMGASNGYDEQDVDQVARIFTGWGLAGKIDVDGLRFEYQPARHFTGACTVTIVHPDGSVNTFSTPGRSGPQGEQDGIDFINWLARRPNTANYLATKLVRRFVGDDPPATLVASAAEVYLANDTAIAPVLRHILTSNEFITNQYPKVRSPFELLVAVLRRTGATIDAAFDPTNDLAATRSISDQLTRLGQAMWQWPTPDGFPDTQNFWVTTDAMLRRWELGGRIGNSTLSGITVDAKALLPTPMPATIDLVVYALAARLGVKVTETDVTGIATFLGVATDAPIASVKLDQSLGDVVGLLLSHPSNQYR